jgi:2-polyprenyl-6-methoxyphenol hydroxylase-like FAD-dependent oxidoreductase
VVGTGLRTLVVGAGIGGLAVARALRLAGHRPEVVECLPESTVGGSGIYLPGNASRALRQLGLHEPLRPFGAAITRQRFLTADGVELFEADVDRLWEGIGECRAVSRADLHQVLLSGAGGEVRYDTAAVDLQIVDSSAKVVFTDGTSAEYDLVIGADGRRSRVRALAGIDGVGRPGGAGLQPRPTGRISYRHVFASKAGIATWTALLGDGVSLVVMPVAPGRLYAILTEAGGKPDGGSGTPTAPPDPAARFRELLAAFRGPVVAELATAAAVPAAVGEEVLARAWSAGPVVLLGDAAHACSPTLSQGAAMALEDAVVLAEELRTAGSVRAALAAYQARRVPRTAWVHERTARWERCLDLPPSERDPHLRRHGADEFRADHVALLDNL